MNNKIKKIFSLIGVFTILSVVLFSSVFNFKNKTAFADTVYSNFRGSLVPINSAVYDNGTKLDAYSITKKAFNFTLVKEDNTNLININQYSSNISEIMTQGDNSTYISWNDYGSFGFAEITQTTTQPHDNTLLAGTYVWADVLNNPFNLSLDMFFFSSFDFNFSSILIESDDDNNFRLYYVGAGTTFVYNFTSKTWSNDAYKTIVLSEDQQVKSSFFDWAITQGNLVYQGGGTTTTITPVDSVNIEYGATSTYSINTYFALSGSNTPEIAGSNKIYYCPVEISTKNLKDLNFVGVNFSSYTDSSSTPNLFYLIFKYFDSNGGYLQFKYETRSFGAYGNISDGVDLTYYFTQTGGDNYKTGFDAGYSQGLVDGDERSSQINYQNGYNAGSDAGYNKGYNAGVEAANDYTFLSLVSAVVTAPFNAFKSLFNFDLLGVNIFNLLGALFTLAVVVTIVKKVI